MQRLENPFPIFLNGGGALLDGGSIYVGEPNADPETDPIALFKDQALTVAIAQPLRTLGGWVVDGANTVFVYMAEDDYSLRGRDINGEEAFYIPSVAVAATAFQPANANLTAIAALATTAFGRSLLTLANQAALQAALGLTASLPLTGGAVSGNITRSGAGVHVYHANPAMTGGRIFVTAAADPDPTSQPGDIWIKI